MALRRRRLATACILAATITMLVLADRRGWLLAGGADDLTRYHGLQTPVLTVIDGDTLVLQQPDPVQRRPTTLVRLWGIDCPEVANDEAPAEPWAAEATEMTRRLLEQGPITLHLEPHRTRGTFGRVLAHVTLPDGSLLAERLLEQGLARADDRWPHAQLSACERAERAAREAQRGLWER